MSMILVLWLTTLTSCSLLNGHATIAPIIPDATTARDFTLSYLNRKYGLPLPEGGAWDTINLIVDQDSPSQAYFYANNGITVVVSFPKDNPNERVFNIKVKNQASVFSWDGLLEASGRITEITVEQATDTPTITPSDTPSQTPLPTSTAIPTSTLTPTRTSV